MQDNQNRFLANQNLIYPEFLTIVTPPKQKSNLILQTYFREFRLPNKISDALTRKATSEVHSSSLHAAAMKVLLLGCQLLTNIVSSMFFAFRSGHILPVMVDAVTWVLVDSLDGVLNFRVERRYMSEIGIMSSVKNPFEETRSMLHNACKLTLR